MKWLKTKAGIRTDFSVCRYFRPTEIIYLSSLCTRIIQA